MTNQADFVNILSTNWLTGHPPPPTYEQSTDTAANNGTIRPSIIGGDRRLTRNLTETNVAASRRYTRSRSVSEDRLQSAKFALKCTLLILLSVFGLVILLVTSEFIAESLNNTRAQELEILEKVVYPQFPPKQYKSFNNDGQYSERALLVNFLLVTEMFISAFAFVVYREKKTGVLFFTTILVFVAMFVGIISVQIPDTDAIFVLYSSTVTFLIILIGFSFAYIGKLKKVDSSYAEYIV